MDDRIGQQLGNYRLLRLLGQGAFADVYLSEHIHLHTQAAIKVLQVRLIENNIQNFLNEARTIAHLVHPYIIRVLDFGVQDNIPFLVMDYAPKGTFRQRFLNGHGQRLPATPLFPYIKQAAAALQYGHDKKLIHRDVKPENMLLGPNDEVLLSDFGFALIQNSNSRSSMETAGTAAYMAPEQLQGKPRPASDQYALGIIAYEWLTGGCPFEGTFFEIASQHMLTAPQPLREKVPSLSPEIENVVMTALAKDPDQRFPSVRDFAIALERACLSAKKIHLDEPLVPPPFLNEPYRPIPNSTSPQRLSTIFPLPLAGEKSPTTEVVQHPFERLSSVVFSQSPQVKTITTHGGSWMNSSSLNDQTRQASQTHLVPQAGQTRPDTIRRSTNWPGNVMPLSELDTPVQTKLPEANSATHNLSQSGIRPFSAQQLSQDSIPSMLQQKSLQERATPVSQSQNLSQSGYSWPSGKQLSQSSQRSLSQQHHSVSGIRPLSPEPNPLPVSQSQNLSQSGYSWPSGEQLSQSSQRSLSQQHHSVSGIRPLSPEPNPLPVSQSQNLSQSGYSWPSGEQLSQSSQRSLSQQHHSVSGIRPLSPEQFSQSGQSSLSSMNSPSMGPATMTSNLRPSSLQNIHQQSTQSRLEQRPDFSSNRAQLEPGIKQQSSQGQLGTEFRDDLQRYRRHGTPTGMVIFFVIMMIFIIGGGAGLIYWSNNQSSNQPATVQGTNVNEQFPGQMSSTATTSASLSATAAANATGTALVNINPYVPGPSTLVVSDPLSSNNQTAQWQENPQLGCQFTNGSYHASAAPNVFTSCFATGTDYTNFTYQIQMIFIQHAPKYSSGGILFRGSTDQHAFYSFEIYASGRYVFRKCSNGGTNCTLLAGAAEDPPLSAFHVDQMNMLAVVASQNTFTLYINQQAIGSQQIDNTSPYIHGLIGVLARGGLGSNTPTQVAYSNIKVWQ